ncbi:hypothetical protein NLI96_g530 [Meripilus lineatus]|uniref:NAD(P)-binding protein n=1 Tax=Meripilus lineatus TaxID=2056292 RepID=A0AAD5VEP7_9APHY|nr:hypothetical protein NLI96_g530 [Physisporinus lineatus]
MSNPQVWFVTGSSSGFGRSIVEFVLSKGHIAVATLRKPEVLNELKSKYPSSQLLVLKVDVTKPEDVAGAFSKTKEVFGRIDVVFNNAGHGILGEIESTPSEVARSMFEINFWGAERVSREAIKFFREVNKPGVGGRLFNISSITGLSASPGLGHYSASKHALEGLTQSLASELDPAWNIKITLIEPSGFVTKGLTENLVKVPAHPAYTKPDLVVSHIRNLVNNATKTSEDADKAVRRFFDLAQLPDPPLRLVIGTDAITFSRKQLQKVAADIDKYEAWSEGLQVDK